MREGRMELKTKCLFDESTSVVAKKLRRFEVIAERSSGLVYLIVPEKEPDGEICYSFEFICVGVGPPCRREEGKVRPLEPCKFRSIVCKANERSEFLS